MRRFTFAIRKSVQDENWFTALFLALCLPDICGSLETPEDNVGDRYKRWFNSNLATKYEPMFSANDCYYFRCSCLHQGLETHANLAHESIHFIPPPPRNNIVHLNRLNNILQIQIDIFCKDIADAVDNWYESIAKNDEGIRSRMESLIKIHDFKSLKPFISLGDQ